MPLVSEYISIHVGEPFRDISYDIVRQARSDDWLSINAISIILPDDWDPRLASAKDGQWVGVVRMKHDVVEWNGYAVPAYEGDLERIEWLRSRS